MESEAVGVSKHRVKGNQRVKKGQQPQDAGRNNGFSVRQSGYKRVNIAMLSGASWASQHLPDLYDPLLLQPFKHALQDTVFAPSVQAGIRCMPFSCIVPLWFSCPDFTIFSTFCELCEQTLNGS